MGKKRKVQRQSSRKHRRVKAGPAEGSDDLAWLGPTACSNILAQIGALRRLLDNLEGNAGGAQLQLREIVGSWKDLAALVSWNDEGKSHVKDLSEKLSSATVDVESSVKSIQSVSESVTATMTKLGELVSSMAEMLSSGGSSSSSSSSSATASAGS